jgi:uncharacterized protein DUF4384
MLLPMLLLLSAGQAVTPAATPTKAVNPAVRVWFNSDGDYERGDRAKVYARAAQDGYLIALQADPHGGVRVLFPIDPQDQQEVRAGKKFELKGRGDREAFVVDDTSGRGTVLAAFSKTPFRFDAFDKNGHWDYDALSARPVADNPEGGLLDVVQQMQTPGEHFEYDVASYVVSTRPYVRLYHSPWSGWWGYGYGPRSGLDFWYGPGRYHYRPWGWRHF